MPEYIAPPIETDPDILATDAFNFLMDAVPGWLPSEGNFEVWLIEALARMTAQLRDITSAVPTSIFRYFGKTLMGIEPVDASYATGYTTWTMTDNKGYVIPDGTQVTIRDSGGIDHPFVTIGDVVVPAGETATDAGEVLITAVFEGSSSSGLSGTVELLDVLSFVQSVAIINTTAGGIDAQTDVEYLNFLVEQLQLMAPRPILARDFAIFVKNVEGVYRACALDMYKPAINEVQTVTVDATGGHFHLTYSGQTTGELAYNITNTALETALEGLSNIGANNCQVSGGPGGEGGNTPYVVTFIGTLGGQDVAQMTADATALTGGGSSVAVATQTAGHVAETDVERYVTVAIVDEQGEVVSQQVKTNAQAYLEEHREQNFVCPILDPTYTSIDIDVTVKADTGVDLSTLQTTLTNVLTDYLSPAAWGIPDRLLLSGAYGPATEWENETYVRYLEVAQVINNVGGVWYITNLSISKHNEAGGQADILLDGVVTLPRAGTITVSVT